MTIKWTPDQDLKGFDHWSRHLHFNQPYQYIIYNNSLWYSEWRGG